MAQGVSEPDHLNNPPETTLINWECILVSHEESCFWQAAGKTAQIARAMPPNPKSLVGR